MDLYATINNGLMVQNPTGFEAGKMVFATSQKYGAWGMVPPG